MSACERCWDLAYWRARRLGGHQVDHYRDLLAEFPEHADTPLGDDQEADR